MRKMRKVSDTEIPIILPTGFTHFVGDEKDKVRSQLEFIGFYSQALFRMIKAAIESMGDFDDREIQWKLGDMIHTCDIGASVGMAIAPLLDIFDDEEIPETELNEIEKPVFIDTDSEIASLAAQLSAVLNNPKIPDELFNNIIEGLDKVSDISKFKTLQKIETGAEYIESVLRDYENAESKSDE